MSKCTCGRELDEYGVCKDCRRYMRNCICDKKPCCPVMKESLDNNTIVITIGQIYFYNDVDTSYKLNKCPYCGTNLEVK